MTETHIGISLDEGGTYVRITLKRYVLELEPDEAVDLLNTLLMKQRDLLEALALQALEEQGWTQKGEGEA